MVQRLAAHLLRLSTSLAGPQVALFYPLLSNIDIKLYRRATKLRAAGNSWPCEALLSCWLMSRPFQGLQMRILQQPPALVE
jgi:hypothetical protein